MELGAKVRIVRNKETPVDCFKEGEVGTVLAESFTVGPLKVVGVRSASSGVSQVVIFDHLEVINETGN